VVLPSQVSAVLVSKCASCVRCVHPFDPFLFRAYPLHSPPPHPSLTPQIIELPLLNPELFQRVGIKPPKGVLLYGPPGTGKTLLARAVAATLETNFLKVVSSAIVDKYIGESARVVREMFGYARDHEPCVIFMDEIDAIGGRRFSEGTSADREIQRTLMEVLSCPCPRPYLLRHFRGEGSEPTY
jgi:DNA polymerase III delta prime subunit